MKEKKKIKISLGTAICIAIIILLVVAIGIVYYLGLVKSKELEADNMELNKQITSLKSENENFSKEISELEKEGNSVNNEYKNDLSVEYSKYIETRKYIENGQITNIDDETKLFTSENPKISFEFPRSWTISSTSDDYWTINIESPQKGVNITIGKAKKLSESEELKDMLHLDFGSTVLNEGNVKISGYNGYYKRYFFGDGPDMTETKSIIINLGNNQYYYIDYSAMSGIYYNDYSKKELKEIYEEYEPIFEKIISSMKF